MCVCKLNPLYSALQTKKKESCDLKSDSLEIQPTTEKKTQNKLHKLNFFHNHEKSRWRIVQLILDYPKLSEKTLFVNASLQQWA